MSKVCSCVGGNAKCLHKLSFIFPADDGHVLNSSCARRSTLYASTLTFQPCLFCVAVVLSPTLLAELSDFCSLLFTFPPRTRLSSPRNHVWGLYSSPKAASLLQNKGPLLFFFSSLLLLFQKSFQVCDALYSGIISGFRWTEERRCIWPPTVQNSIKAKSDLLCTTSPLCFYL